MSIKNRIFIATTYIFNLVMTSYRFFSALWHFIFYVFISFQLYLFKCRISFLNEMTNDYDDTFRSHVCTTIYVDSCLLIDDLESLNATQCRNGNKYNVWLRIIAYKKLYVWYFFYIPYHYELIINFHQKWQVMAVGWMSSSLKIVIVVILERKLLRSNGDKWWYVDANGMWL